MVPLAKHTIRYCPDCGHHSLSFTIPEGDNRQRYRCPKCHYIQYFNPIPVVGAILDWRDKILLCRRSIEPRKNFWTYPAGFMELRESLLDGTRRECGEEARAVGVDMRLYAVYSLFREGQIHFIYRGRLKDGRAEVGEESSEVRLFQLEEIPWDKLAFPVIYECLKRYQTDKRQGRLAFHQGVIVKDDDGNWKTSYHGL